MVNFGSIFVAIGIPVIRSVGGWAVKATADKKITKFEFKQLLRTILRTGVIGLLIFLGAGSFGFDISVVGSAASAVIFDMVLSAWKENKNITQR